MRQGRRVALTIGLLIAALGASALYITRTQQAATPPTASHTAPAFITVSSQEALEAELANAASHQQIAFVDYYADWCIPCKQFATQTFTDPKVAKQLSHMHRIKVNLSENRPDDFALMRRQDVAGLPTIDFWLPSGERDATARITGFLSPQDFITHLNQHGLQREIKSEQ
ncbi:thioredoxin fold domain-containing protein [Salinivibrio sp. ES.052]|uniref:thioredoxin fold domain-containing protein n=1 Tax=Salinivibrio sp. ES.052 TaxID=1882823 RepID=UPI000928C83A|nr:thioredoxin fold domain-containing protein [Salinivibrio sp. ES.052]SIO25416.1 Thioredoxin-like domain-containing protein [Salinivibrio sp. ES.052]